jgi:alkyldihydroxyacetonephosphate synthase
MEIGEPAWRRLAQAFAMPALLATPPRASITPPSSRLTAVAIEKLTALLGASGVRLGNLERARHAAGRGLADQLRVRAGDLSTAPDAVLYPRNEADVLAVLKLCAELGIAVRLGGDTPQRGAQASVVTLNPSGLNRITFDAVSGLVEAEAGIALPELEGHLAERGMTLGVDDLQSANLGSRIARAGAARTDWLHSVRAATPQGLLGGDLARRILPGSRGALGIITSATLRVRTLPQKEDDCAWLFPDFASGLAAMRHAQRGGQPHGRMRLSDDGATRLARALQTAGDWNLKQRLFDAYLAFRGVSSNAARLSMSFAGSDSERRAARKNFRHLARKLGAVPLDAAGPQPDFMRLREALLERATGIDWIDTAASWAELPSAYVRVRAALKQAMRTMMPLPGAHGLVLCQVGPAWPVGAKLRFTWLYPRKLEQEVTQAETIHRAALATAGRRDEGLEPVVLRSIQQALDPKAILSSAKS